MLYTMQNERLKVTANTQGGELWTIHAQGSADFGCLWDGKPEIWGRRAPILFPWCSKLEDGYFEDQGRRWKAGQHGFIRDLDHKLVEAEENRIHFRVDWEKDEDRWPWSFSFDTVHTLEGNDVVTTCTGTNLDSRPMPAQLGFHPALRCPFTPGKIPQDYIVRFEQPESLDGTDVFRLDPEVFDNDSICFSNLKSKWLQVEEKETGRYLRVGTEGFPFVLLWSKPGITDFVCIEPWTGYLGPGHDLAARPGTQLLAPGQAMTRTQRITVGL